MTAVTEAGVYDMPAPEYHADPCPTPSLSAGMINDVLKAPALCFENSARLNPDFEPRVDDGKFTIGTVSHVMHLEPELFDERVVVVDADDWRSIGARVKRQEAHETGKTAILAKHFARVRSARLRFLNNAFTSGAVAGGKAEQSIFWRHPVHGFWCRARPDYLAPHHMCDYKATFTADPNRFGKHAFSMGYHRRAAWYLEGAAILGLPMRHYWFVNQETFAPYLTSVCELDFMAIDAGHAENEEAAALYAYCLESGDWFGYRKRDDRTKDTAFSIALPNYAYMNIDARK